MGCFLKWPGYTYCSCINNHPHAGICTSKYNFKWLHFHGEAKGLLFPEQDWLSTAGILGCCELHDMSPGNWTGILWKNRKSSLNSALAPAQGLNYTANVGNGDLFHIVVLLTSTVIGVISVTSPPTMYASSSHCRVLTIVFPPLYLWSFLLVIPAVIA